MWQSSSSTPPNPPEPPSSCPNCQSIEEKYNALLTALKRSTGNAIDIVRELDDPNFKARPDTSTRAKVLPFRATPVS
jgi:hypothetical protein